MKLSSNKVIGLLAIAFYKTASVMGTIIEIIGVIRGKKLWQL